MFLPEPTFAAMVFKEPAISERRASTLDARLDKSDRRSKSGLAIAGEAMAARAKIADKLAKRMAIWVVGGG